MARPVRGAALRARELIAKGYNVQVVDSIGTRGMSPEEEDELDEEIALHSESEKPHFFPFEDGIDLRGTGVLRTDIGFSSYDVQDVGTPGVFFRPERPPGPHLTERITRTGIRKFTREIDFFQLFFDEELLQMIVDNTDTYAWLNILEKPSYAKKDGSWEPTSIQEIKNMIALLIFHGFAGCVDLERNWSQATLYSGGWARRFMSRNRFKALNGMLHISKPGEEDVTDKLAKVRPLIEHIRKACGKYYQPYMAVSVDERMVRSKGRSPIRQYMPDKPTRFGYKLWCACDAATGYTLDFSIYTGKSTTRSANGLGYDVVSSLSKPFFNQGYRMYCDNFFSSFHLAKHLLQNGTFMCGTMQYWRRGFPVVLKDKAWSKSAKQGDMRYVRTDDVLFVQWVDKRVVNMVSTAHKGHKSVMLLRHGKDSHGVYQCSLVRVPSCVHYYNKHMGGVDLADQMIETYNVLVKTTRWWKTLFFHCVDMAILNSYLLFKSWRALHPDLPGLQRCVGYSHLHFREELVRQLANISDDEDVPLYYPGIRWRKSLNCSGPHPPEFTRIRRNCRVCYVLYKKQVKSYVRCSDPQCRVHLCFNRHRNCFPTWHSAQFDKYR